MFIKIEGYQNTSTRYQQKQVIINEQEFKNLV